MITIARRTVMPRAERQLICKGDEATVSRLWHCNDPALEGWVERRQPIRALRHSIVERDFITDPHVGVRFSFRNRIALSPGEEAYHALAYFAMRVARLLFPTHFAEYVDWRVARIGALEHSLVYSRFIPDETGVIEQRARSMERYYEMAAREGREAAKTIRNAFDDEMVSRHPEIQDVIRDAMQAGIVMGHSTANVHISDGRPVFLEVDGLDVGRLARLPVAQQEQILPELLSAYTAVLFGICRIYLERPHSHIQKNAERLQAWGFEETVRRMEVYVKNIRGLEELEAPGELLRGQMYEELFS